MINFRNIIIGFGNTITNTYVNITRQKFVINKEWLDQLFIKHYSKEVDSKYISELFVDTGIAEDTYDEITNIDKDIPRFLNELRILKDWLSQFINEYKELQLLLVKQNITVNQTSSQHKQLDLLKSKNEYFNNTIKTYNEVLKAKDLNPILKLEKIQNVGLELPTDFKISRLDVYREDDKYIDKAPNPDDRYTVEIVFRRLQEITSQINSLNRFLDRFQRQVFIIHGNAGMGKSNISYNLSGKLKSNNLPIVFIQAKSFRGSPDEFESIFMRELNVPDNYQLSEVLERLNNYGVNNSIRVSIIIDGLNETTFAHEGFSLIWKNSLDNFITELKEYKNIYFIATLRTSYIERIWSSNTIPYQNHQLTGFNYEILESVVKTYFEYYKITYNEINQSDIFYFRTPLLLDLYCKMLNSERLVFVPALLGIAGYIQVFEKYIAKLATKIKIDLNHPSTKVITDGIKRCSNAFLKKLDAQLELADYYTHTQNKPIEDINTNTSFAHSILEEYLIYIRDAVHGLPEDIVRHTQQEIGGYLLAKELLDTHGTIENVVISDFYKNHLVGEDLHQLKDDILNFLITFSIDRNDYITQYSMDSELQTQLWRKLQVEPASAANDSFRTDLLKKVEYQSELDVFLYNSRSSFLLDNSSINFFPIVPLLKSIKEMNFEMTWTKFIYENYFNWDNYLGVFIEDIKTLEPGLEITKTDSLRVELAVWLLETTIRDLRDKVTAVLLEFGAKHPKYIFDKTFEYSNVPKIYIYERLTAICYGVCLRKQNDNDFINGLLKEQVQTIYNLQFGNEPTAPSFNYIAIDSLKHIVDLALYKGVFTLEQQELKLLKNYNFNLVNQWVDITNDNINYVTRIVNSWHNRADSDPLKGDFVHYTIPRLQERGEAGPENRLTATANIFKRIIELGYITEDKFETSDKKETDFYFGSKPYGFEGKIDRLGKKYSWMAFFDYAGHLINQGLLNVWSGEEDEKVYNRLGDVEIEVSNPKLILLGERLFNVDLLEHKNNKESWTEKPFYEESKLIWNQDFEDGNFTLVKGYLEQRPDKSYDVRTFLLIESFLVSKEEIIGKEESIINRNYDWRNDINTNDSLSNVYFGELYWADNIPDSKPQRESIPTELEEVIEYTLTMRDIISSEDYNDKKVGNKVTETVKSRVSFEIEPTNSEYMWESDSDIFKTLRGNIPSPNLGKYLKLKADAENFQILDEKGSLAFKSYEFEKPDLIKQELDYLRTDLLKKYMDDNGLVLMYQIKQHTYDRITGTGNGDFRGMQFFFPHLDNN